MDEVKLTQELVRINSENPPGNEKEIAKFIRDYLDDLKIPVKLIKFDRNRFNVIASLGKGDGLMLAGHTDTVPTGDPKNWKFNPFGGKIVDDKIYGRGSTDMKSGLAAILTAVKKFKKENPKEYRLWRLTQLINYGLDGEKLDKQEVKKSWFKIKDKLDPYKKRALEYLIWGKLYSLPNKLTFWNLSRKSAK